MANLHIIGVIPARYASTRFPGKPLVDIMGKSMIERVYTQCKQASLLHDLVVATDDDRIYMHVEAFGGKAVMTADYHQSGTERITELLPYFPEATHFVNIQGDEPFIAPEQIDLLCRTLTARPDIQLATLLKEIDDVFYLDNPGSVKVVLNHKGEALYFSRSPIPFFRNATKEKWLSLHTYYRHIGIYGYTREALAEIKQLRPALLEQAESLEQLRWLYAGMRIQTALSAHESESIDTPEDLQRVLAQYKKQ